MANPAAPLPRPERIRFRWLIDRSSDLIWYIGSALAGWLYVGLILLAVSVLPDPMTDAFGTIRIGGLQIPLTLHLLVYASWAFLLDAPHLWSTLARTFLDPDERQVRRRELWLSWGWFLVGPAAILAGGALGALLFTIAFRLWAYYHVVRQHWGFYMLYKRKNEDMAPRAFKVDSWLFHIAFYAPLLMFLTNTAWIGAPAAAALGVEPITRFLHGIELGSVSLAEALHGAAWTIYLGMIGYYLYHQVSLWRTGRPLNGPKLLLLALLLPLHLVAFNNPWLVALLVPIVTVGHNLQYHRIVWSYGQNKYVTGQPRSGFAVTRAIFSRFWVYAALGLLFTFALYRGPWIDWLQSATGMALNASIFRGVGMMAGLDDPASLTLGQQLFGAFLLGWAMQHYYLDSKIWRVSKDKAVAQQLKV